MSMTIDIPIIDSGPGILLVCQNLPIQWENLVQVPTSVEGQFWTRICLSGVWSKHWAMGHSDTKLPQSLLVETIPLWISKEGLNGPVRERESECEDDSVTWWLEYSQERLVTEDPVLLWQCLLKIIYSQCSSFQRMCRHLMPQWVHSWESQPEGGTSLQPGVRCLSQWEGWCLGHTPCFSILIG